MRNSSNGIAFWFGTEAEVLKSFPVILRMRQNNSYPKIISTGQNDLAKSDVVLKHNLLPDFIISHFKNKKLPTNLILWFLITILFHSWKVRSYIKNNDIKYLVVHGDTISALMGSGIGWLSGAKIVHLEAGLRSHNLFDPFPEEIDRILVDKIASILFCQDEEAIENLKAHKGQIINTHRNVICDTVDMFAGSESTIRRTLSDKYAIATFHRAEQVLARDKLNKLVDTTLMIAEKMQTLFVLFDFTRELLEKSRLLDELESHPNIIITPRVQYSEFITLMANAQLVMTDGGSNQEELAYLGVPTLIMRTHTERKDGLGSNIVLSKFDDEIIERFLNDYRLLRTKRVIQQAPSKIVADHLLCLE